MQFFNAPQTTTLTTSLNSSSVNIVSQVNNAYNLNDPISQTTRSSSTPCSSFNVDLNGDGKTDLFWFNNQTGETRAWLMNGNSSPTAVHFGRVSPNAGWQLAGFGDFNGDHKTDVFWFNLYTGKTTAWLMNGTTSPTAVQFGDVPASSAWQLKGFGDFNGDGKTDLFWHNTLTGDTGAWLMDGTNPPKCLTFNNVAPDAGWQLKGFADFNGDGKTDVLWSNSQNGHIGAWLMGETTPTCTSIGNVSPNAGWTFEGLSDFNKDGKTDLLLYNQQTGDVQVWLINESPAPTTIVHSKKPAQSGWSFEGIGDLNGDGQKDVFWYNRQTGETEAWLMRGGNIVTSVGCMQDTSSYWDSQAMGDFNGDGKTSLFWRNYGLNSADTRTWSMDAQHNYTDICYGLEPTESGWQLISPNQMSGLALR